MAKKITYKLDIDTGNSEKELKGVNKGVKDIGKTSKKSSKDVDMMGDAFDGVGGALGGAKTQLQAFLAMLKANPIVAAIAVIIAVSTALYKYSKAALKAAKDTTKVSYAMGVTRTEANELRKDINALSAVWEVEFNDVLKASNVFMKEFGISGTESLDLINEGFEKGANVNGEFLEQLKEYPAFLKQMGLSAKEAMSFMITTEQSGVFSDKGIDAIKTADERLRLFNKAAQDSIKVFDKKTQSEIKSLIASDQRFKAMQLISKSLQNVNLTAQETTEVIDQVFRGQGIDAGDRYIEMLGEMDLELENNVSILSEAEIASNAFTDSWSRLTDEMLEAGGALDGIMNSIKTDFSETFERWTEILDSNANAWYKLAAIILPSVGAHLTYVKVLEDGTASQEKAIKLINKEGVSREELASSLKKNKDLYKNLSKRASYDLVISKEERKSLDATLASVTALTKALKELDDAKAKEDAVKKTKEDAVKADAAAVKKANSEYLKDLSFRTNTMKKEYKIQLKDLQQSIKDKELMEDNALYKQKHDYELGLIDSDEYYANKHKIENTYGMTIFNLNKRLSKLLTTSQDKVYENELDSLDKQLNKKLITQKEYDQKMVTLKLDAASDEQAINDKLVAIYERQLNSIRYINEEYHKDIDKKYSLSTSEGKLYKGLVDDAKTFWEVSNDIAIKGSEEKLVILDHLLKLEMEKEKIKLRENRAFKLANEEDQDKMLLAIRTKYLDLMDKLITDNVVEAHEVELKLLDAHLVNLEKGSDEWLKTKGKILERELAIELREIKHSNQWKLYTEEEQQQLLLDIKQKYINEGKDLIKESQQEIIDFTFESTTLLIDGFAGLNDAFAEANAVMNETIINGVVDTNAVLLTELERRHKLELNALEQSFHDGLLTEETYLKNKTRLEYNQMNEQWKLEDESARREEAARRKAFDDKKRYEQGALWMNTASSILGTWSGYAEMGVPGAILAGIQTAFILGTAGVQSNNIANQTYGDGGILQGPSHANNGIRLNNQEIGEGGEFIINKASTAKNINLLTAINDNPDASVNAPGIDYDRLANSLADVINDKQVVLTQNDLVNDENDRVLISESTTF